MKKEDIGYFDQHIKSIKKWDYVGNHERRKLVLGLNKYLKFAFYSIFTF